MKIVPGEARDEAPIESTQLTPTLPMNAIHDAVLHDLPHYAEADAYERTCLLRRWTYEHSMVASTVDTLTKREPDFGSMEPTEFLDIFREGSGGLWCHGTAHFLRGVYAEMGFDAYAFSYGLPESTTHTATLVCVQGEIHLQDAYFNCSYVDEDGTPTKFFSLLERLSGHLGVRRRDEPTALRPVLAKTPQPCWTNDNNADPTIWRPHPGVLDAFVGHFRTSFEVFERCIFSADASRRQLAEDGLPPDLDYLPLYPLWLHDGERMYGEGHDSGKLLGEIEAYAAIMRNRAREGAPSRRASAPDSRSRPF